jgi:aldehyde:ferredoxin oxidoreductase
MAYLTWDAKAGKPKVEFFGADQYKGGDLYEIYPKVYKRFGTGVSIAGFGVAAEYGYANSGIVFNDLVKRPSRYSGRGGLGAVMASKGLKFIVTDAKGAPGVSFVDKALFGQGAKKLADALRTHDVTKPKGTLNTYGTAALINVMNEAGGLPTINFAIGNGDDSCIEQTFPAP